MFYLSHSSPLILPSFIRCIFENCAFPFDSPIRSIYCLCVTFSYFPHWTLCGCILTFYQSNVFGESLFRLPDNSFHFIILIVPDFVLYDVRCVLFSLFFFLFVTAFFCKQFQFVIMNCEYHTLILYHLNLRVLLTSILLLYHWWMLHLTVRFSLFGSEQMNLVLECITRATERKLNTRRTFHFRNSCKSIFIERIIHF